MRAFSVLFWLILIGCGGPEQLFRVEPVQNLETNEAVIFVHEDLELEVQNRLVELAISNLERERPDADIKVEVSDWPLDAGEIWRGWLETGRAEPRPCCFLGCDGGNGNALHAAGVMFMGEDGYPKQRVKYLMQPPGVPEGAQALEVDRPCAAAAWAQSLDCGGISAGRIFE